MRTFAALVLLGCLSPALLAEVLPELPAPLAERVNSAREACASFNGGQFALEWGAVVRDDLEGDLYPGWVLNESGFACSSAASLYCGTGGCESHFLVDDMLTTLLN